MTESKIQEILISNFDHLYQLTNVFVFGWESDYFGMTKGTGYIYEVEIKLSKSDFHADFKKEERHRCLELAKQERITIPREEEKKYGKTGEIETSTDRLGNLRQRPVHGYIPQGYSKLVIKNNMVPNRFFYAVPKKLFDDIKDLVPDYAGLILMEKYDMKIVKQAPLLHKRNLKSKLDSILLSKFYNKCLDLKRKIYGLEYDLKKDKYYYDENFEENMSDLEIEF